MRWQRILWAAFAVFILLLMVAPIASYCLGRDQDYQDKVSQAVPIHAPQPSTAIAAPLIPNRVN